MHNILKHVEIYSFLFNAEIKGAVLLEAMSSEGINNMFCKKVK